MSSRKKIFETSAEKIVSMYGYLGAKSGQNRDLAVSQWKESFTRGCHFAEPGEPDTYDEVWFLRNTNFYPFFEKSPGIWVKDQHLPIFHAAAVFARGVEPLCLYLFNHDSDLSEMLDEYPYDGLLMEDGRPYIEVATERDVRFYTKNYREEPTFPPGWEGDCHCIDHLDLISLPYWESQKMRDSVYDLSARILDAVDRLITGKPETGECSPKHQYIFDLPEAELFVYHVAMMRSSDSIIMVQNDLWPGEPSASKVSHVSKSTHKKRKK